MDADLRRLKRQADSGDIDALRRYCHLLERLAGTKGCRLLPLNWRCHANMKRNPDRTPAWGFSHTILPLGRDYDLWERIEALPQLEMSKEFRQDFTCYCSNVPDGSMKGESCYGTLLEDCYGNQLQWVTAGDLVKAFQDLEETEGEKLSIPNAAALAYLIQLEPDNPIALYWH